MKINGFLKNIKDKGKVSFLEIQDVGGNYHQVVNFEGKNKDLIKALTLGSYIEVEGEMVLNEGIKNEKFRSQEIRMDSVRIITSSQILPTLNMMSSIDAAKNFRHLQLRETEYRFIMELNHYIQNAMREYYTQNGYTIINTPKLMGTPSEGGAEVFEVDFYEKKAYLAQSPQFYKQMAMAAGLGRVYEIGPVFRADPSFTSRHLAEFISVDAEISDINDHYDVMHEQEKLLIFIFEYLDKKGLMDKVNTVFKTERSLLNGTIPKITLSDVKKILQDTYNHEVPSDKDLDQLGEQLIGKYVKETLNSDFVYVINYDSDFRPFYHMIDDETGLTKSFDLLYKGVEISTGAQREHRLDVLKFQALNVKKSVPLEQIKEYLSYFSYGIPQHGGYGLGLERFIKQLIGIENIKEIPFMFVSANRLPS